MSAINVIRAAISAAAGSNSRIVLTNAVYDSVFLDVTPEQGQIRDFVFRPNGAEVFVCTPRSGAGTNGRIRKYDLSIPWDLGSAVYSGVSFITDTQENAPGSVRFSPDGAFMFVAGLSADRLWRYDLSTPWDITTAVVAQSLDYRAVYSTSVLGPAGFIFTADGTRLFQADTIRDAIDMFDLSTPWDLTTAVRAAGATLDVTPQLSDPYGIALQTDGSQIFILSNTFERLYSYTLSTPYDLATAGAPIVLEFTASSEGTATTGLNFGRNNSKMYIANNFNNRISQYSL